MITPSGSFETNKRLCLSMSDYHPESWNPLWSVASILNGLLSFMLEESPTVGSIKTGDADKRKFARNSLDFNKQNPSFKKLFPQLLANQSQLLPNSKENQTTHTLTTKEQQTDIVFCLMLLLIALIGVSYIIIR